MQAGRRDEGTKFGQKMEAEEFVGRSEEGGGGRFVMRSDSSSARKDGRRHSCAVAVVWEDFSFERDKEKRKDKRGKKKERTERTRRGSDLGRRNRWQLLQFD